MSIEELEERALKLKDKIKRLEARLEKTRTRLHQERVKESNLVGRIARSTRIPNGIVITDVTFKTWEPSSPQSVSGHRVGRSDVWTTIHLTSPGYEIDAAEARLHPPLSPPRPERSHADTWHECPHP
jgi:hypothetical protein